MPRFRHVCSVGTGETSGTKELRLGWLVGDMPDEKAFLIALHDNDPGRVGERNI